jgi:uncharacterized protein YukE
MTDASFTADPDGLDALGQRLTGIADSMQGLAVDIDRYQPSDLSPSGDVWDGLKTLNEQWSRALSTINGNVSALQQRLAGAGQLYRETDQQIGDVARQGMATLRPDGMLA